MKENFSSCDWLISGRNLESAIRIFLTNLKNGQQKNVSFLKYSLNLIISFGENYLNCQFSRSQEENSVHYFFKIRIFPFVSAFYQILKVISNCPRVYAAFLGNHLIERTFADGLRLIHDSIKVKFKTFISIDFLSKI